MPLRGFLEQVYWISLEELGEQKNLDAAVDLLTLPVRSEQELAERCRWILANRRDLEPVVFSMLFLITQLDPQPPCLACTVVHSY